MVDVTEIFIHWLRVVRRSRSRPVLEWTARPNRVHQQCALESGGLVVGAGRPLGTGEPTDAQYRVQPQHN